MNNLTGSASVNIKAPISKVWEAITKPEIIKQYLFGTNTITDWKVGSPVQFQGNYEGKDYVDRGTVLAFQTEELLKFSYFSSMSGKEDKPENYVTVSYKLQRLGDNETSLQILQENIADEKTKEHSENNWKKVLATLKNLLEDSQEVPAY
jgi:uncharacterized protein YndB with AHSA1/START domain